MREPGEVDAALPKILTAPGPVLYVAKVRAEPLPFALPPRDGAFLKDRFRHALLGEDATPLLMTALGWERHNYGGGRNPTFRGGF